MTNAIEKLQARIDVVETWNGRFDKLSKDGMLLSNFCRKHGFHLSHIMRAKEQKPLPLDKFIKRVEDALAKEGV